MDASDVKTASDLSDRVLRDLDLFAQRLDDARTSADPGCGEPSEKTFTGSPRRSSPQTAS